MIGLLQIREPGQTPLPHEDEDVAVGIDLGTTYSLAAVAEGGKAEVLRDAAGSALVPSVVAYLDSGVLVGEAASAALAEHPDRVVASVKRLMGRGEEDILRVAGRLPYEVESAADMGSPGMVRLRVGGRVLTPVEVSAEILRSVRARGEGSLGHSVTRAVITVPAHFDDAARTATRDAARLAGVEPLRLVNEPTAAALAYGLDTSAEGLYAVYDLGGGTFDISVLRLRMGVFQVLATGGDPLLGGDDFDLAIAEHFLRERAGGGGSQVPTAGAAKLAMDVARRAKEGLTDSESGEWTLDAEGRTSEHRLNRATLDALIAPHVERTFAIVGRVLDDAGVAASEIQGVVLAGGSTRVQLVRRRVAEVFGRPPLTDLDPDEVVALGAALQAEALTRGSDTLLLDVTPLSLGIETMGGLAEKILPRNTPVPSARTQEFTTYQDGQTALSVHVVQGERELVTENRSLARFELAGIPPMTAGAARIRVTFAVDADGLLTVAASEATTGVLQEVAVKPSYGLGEEEVTRMLRDSMEHAHDDMEARLLQEARVDGKAMLQAVRAALDADGDLLTDAEQASIETGAGRLAELVAGTDRAAIREAVEAFNAATETFAGRRMDRGIRAALTGRSLASLAERLENQG